MYIFLEPDVLLHLPPAAVEFFWRRVVPFFLKLEGNKQYIFGPSAIASLFLVPQKKKSSAIASYFFMCTLDEYFATLIV